MRGARQLNSVDDLEVDPDLLDLGRAVALRIEAGAGVLEFDLRIENDIGRDQVGRQQTTRAEAVLPLAVGSRVLLRPVTGAHLAGNIPRRRRCPIGLCCVGCALLLFALPGLTLGVFVVLGRLCLRRRGGGSPGLSAGACNVAGVLLLS
jgi:hypothetical protein